MKNMRIPLLVVLGVAIIGIILGSFLDLNISRAIAFANSELGLTISAIGPTIAGAVVTKDVAKNSVVGGNPAKLIKNIE